MKQLTFSVLPALFLLTVCLSPAESRQFRTRAVTSQPRSTAGVPSGAFRDHQVVIASPAPLRSFQTSRFEVRQFRTRVPVVGQPGFSAGFRSPVFIDGRRAIIVTAAPVRVFPTRRFQTVVVVPRRAFVSRPIIISQPFVCFPHHLGFFREDFFFDHIHRFHGLSFESIPPATVQNGSQIIFFEDPSGSVAPTMEDSFSEDQQ